MNMGLQKSASFILYCTAGCSKTGLHPYTNGTICKRRKGQLLNSVPDRGELAGAQLSVYKEHGPFAWKNMLNINNRSFFG